MMVANRATLSGISEQPSLPLQGGIHGDIHGNISLELSPAPLGFGWMAAHSSPSAGPGPALLRPNNEWLSTMDDMARGQLPSGRRSGRYQVPCPKKPNCGCCASNIAGGA